jgi:hypothetical protein
MSTQRVCLHERLPSGATRLVQPLQLQKVEPSVNCWVSYSIPGLESDSKVQPRVICLFMLLTVVGLVTLAPKAERNLF